MKFTEEQTIKFVQEFIKHDCLLNPNCHEYKNKTFRKAALQLIAQKMKIPGFGTKEAYIKMRSLKSTYLQENKKILQSKMTNERYSYVPNVKWFEIFDNAFKSSNVTTEAGEAFSKTTNLPNYVQEAEAEEELDIAVTKVKSEAEEEMWPDESNEYSIILESPSPPKANDLPTDVQKEDISVIITQNPRKRKINIENEENGQNTSQAVVSKYNSDVENEFDIFGKSVAAQLKNMPFDLALEAQMVIQNHLSEIRLKNHRRTSTMSQFDNCPQSSSSFN